MTYANAFYLFFLGWLFGFTFLGILHYATMSVFYFVHMFMEHVK